MAAWVRIADRGGVVRQSLLRPMTCLPWQAVPSWAEADYDENNRFSPLPIRSGEHRPSGQPENRSCLFVSPLF